MKQISQSKSVDLPPTELYLEDIDELCQIIRGAAKNVRIEVPGYELESPDELAALSKQLPTKVLHEFKIKAREPYIILEIYPHSSHLYISDQTLELLGIQTKITEFMIQRRQTFWWAMNPWLVSFLAPIAIFAGAKFNKWVFGATAIIVIAAYWWTYRRTFRSHTIFFLSSRKERDSFWMRNRDKIILAILSALIGAIAKGLYEYIST